MTSPLRIAATRRSSAHFSRDAEWHLCGVGGRRLVVVSVLVIVGAAASAALGYPCGPPRDPHASRAR
jgi:hypothetical protein